MPLGTIIGLWALLSLIPLILLYLRRPKPIEKVFPSLMFLMKEKGAVKQQSFFRNLLRNLLFLMQLLVLIIISLSLAEPYLPSEGVVLGQQNVIVIDASASSQTKINGMTRFEKSIEEAKKYVNGRTSIILAGAVPEIVLEKGSKGAAIEILGRLKPKDTTTNLEAAISAAEPLVKRGRIVVISDFKSSEGQDPLVVKRIVTAKGIPVDFIDTGSKAENIGIIDMSVSKYETKVYVKNFNAQEESVSVSLVQKEVVSEKTKAIKPGSVEVLSFPTLLGRSKIELDAKDDFELDNQVFISTPSKMKINVLLITNPKYEEGSQIYLKNALESSKDIELQIAEPPVLPALSGYDVIILGGVFSDMLLPSFFREVSTSVDNGTSFIVTAHENLGNIAFQNLLPIRIKGVKEEETKVTKNIVNKFTKDIDFSIIKVNKYFMADADNLTAVVASIKESPVIAIKEKGGGKLVYIGIMDKYSDFKLSPDYPIFWNLLLNSLTGTERVEDYNAKLNDRPFIEKVGYYKEQNKYIAVNLLNAQESDVSKEKLISEMEKEMSVEEEKEEARFSLVIPLLILSSLIILLELIYIKATGDL